MVVFGGKGNRGNIIFTEKLVVCPSTYLNWSYNPLLVRKNPLSFKFFHRGFLYQRHRPHGHSQGLSFPFGYTYTRGLLRSWKINRHDISAAQFRLEAGWNHGDSSLQSLFRVERRAITKSDLSNGTRSFGTYKYFVGSYYRLYFPNHALNNGALMMAGL